MSERIIDGRPRLTAPEERLALPAPGGAPDNADAGEAKAPWYRRRGLWIGIAVLVAILLATLLLGGGDREQGKGGARPPAVVNVARAMQTEWSAEVRAIGTLVAIQGVNVTTELAGNVVAIRFANGGRVRAGETLVQLDTTTERAQLASLVAQRDQARLAYDRALRLIKRGAIAQAQVEEAEATFENLQAQVEQTRTVIEKKRINAPFSGDLGIRQVNLGQYLAPGTAIVPLQQIAPIYVNLEVPENAFPKLRVGQSVRLRLDAFPGRPFEGRINAINPQIAQSTRSVTVQATIPNRDRVLRPGMFADVNVLLPGSRRVVLVPASAVTTNAYGDTVYKVARPDPRREQQKAAQKKKAEQEKGGLLSGLFGGGSDTAESKQGGDKAGEPDGQPQSRWVARTQFVRTGERRGNQIEIIRGLRPGEAVVSAGQLKLEDDAPILPSNQPAGRGGNPRPQNP